MIRVGVVGLGKMGLSHLSILGPHPHVELVGVCDTSKYLLSVLGKYTGVPAYDSFEALLAEARPDAVVIATPSFLHDAQVRAALEAGVHVFCEKPFTLEPASSRALTALAAERGLVTQVGYHYRYVGAFQEAKRLLDAGAIGTVTRVLAEAYGPVVLKPKGGSWRSKAASGGGSLYDYAAHPLNLLTWYFGNPTAVSGTVLGKVFSRETDDEVAATIQLDGGAHAQLSVNWSDESQRKMTTKITAWGTTGRLFVDRQELQLYVREGETPPAGYGQGWNVRHTTELTAPVDFYVRGEEYSAQLDDFVERVRTGTTAGVNDFASAAATDAVIAALVTDADRAPTPVDLAATTAATAPRARSGLRRLLPTR